MKFIDNITFIVAGFRVIFICSVINYIVIKDKRKEKQGLFYSQSSLLGRGSNSKQKHHRNNSNNTGILI